jgi:hypothetical protein
LEISGFGCGAVELLAGQVFVAELIGFADIHLLNGGGWRWLGGPGEGIDASGALLAAIEAAQAPGPFSSALTSALTSALPAGPVSPGNGGSGGIVASSTGLGLLLLGHQFTQLAVLQQLGHGAD